MIPYRMVVYTVRNSFAYLILDLCSVCLLLCFLDMPDRIAQYRPRWQAPSAKAADLEYNRLPWRKEDAAFYHSAAWLGLRKAFVMAHPLCAICKAAGVVKVATHVHHLKDRREYPELALDWDNLQSQCCSCHSRLHARRPKV